MSKIEGGPASIAALGMKAQQARMRVIAENMANADSTARTPGGDPYRRQVAIFEPLKLEDNSTSVQMVRPQPDPKDFKLSYEPSHPGANAEGYVKLPNVEMMIEAMDMKDAQRAYEANLNVIENTDAMEQRTLDLLK